jgi:hypothetical protein
MKFVQLIYIICYFVFSACSSVLSSETPHTKEINGLSLHLKYLSPTELAQKEKGDDAAVNPDSIKKLYSQSLQFVLSITPKDKSDVMTSSVKNYNEYAQLSHNMNFEMEKMVYLKIGTSIYYPVLSAMENTYGMKVGRDIVFAFAPSSKEDKIFYNSDSICFTYRDELFDLGINHFSFSREEITDIN